MNVATGIARNALDRLRAAILGDAAWQAALDAHDDADAFAAHALSLAAAHGIPLTREALMPALRDDPLGLARWSDMALRTEPPPQGWLPIEIIPMPGALCIEWAYFGARPLRAPFFEGDARRALRRPLGRLIRYRTRLADLPQGAERLGSLPPSGFIFHMSRCGSTLATQMLAADPRTVVVSEARPLDAVVQMGHAAPPRLLTAMVGALGRKRDDGQNRAIVKLDSWHTLALPLFRRVFPAVPWVFLYREPAEVLASQMLQRGIQTTPEHFPPAMFGLESGLPGEIHCARVLARTCEAVLEPFAQGGGLLVNYRDLPQALWSHILPHFGMAAGADDRARMEAAARNDAKAPDKVFGGDDGERRRLTETVRATAEREIGGVYARLEALRLGARVDLV
jgi:hypothetical protein